MECREGALHRSTLHGVCGSNSISVLWVRLMRLFYSVGDIDDYPPSVRYIITKPQLCGTPTVSLFYYDRPSTFGRRVKRFSRHLHVRTFLSMWSSFMHSNFEFLQGLPYAALWFQKVRPSFFSLYDFATLTATWFSHTFDAHLRNLGSVAVGSRNARHAQSRSFPSYL